MRILITSGGTREYIDPVRFITNASSGKMGFALTRAALKAGHKVTLITTVENPEPRTPNPEQLKIVTVQTASQMFKAVKKYFPWCDCLIMAAAVADYTPVRPAKTKIKKQDKTLILKLKPTVDILKWAGEQRKSKIKNQKSKLRKGKQLVVGFALEDKDIRRRAERKMREKNLDMIIANTPAAIGSDKVTSYIKRRDSSWTKLGFVSKHVLARRILNEISYIIAVRQT